MDTASKTTFINKSQTSGCEPARGVPTMELGGRFTCRDTAPPDQQRMLADDRAWFAAHPDREYRARAPMLGDVPDGPIAPEERIVVRVVARLPNGDSVRLKVPVIAVEGEDLTTETGCRQAWERARQYAPEIEELRRAIRRAVRKLRAAARFANEGGQR